MSKQKPTRIIWLKEETINFNLEHNLFAFDENNPEKPVLRVENKTKFVEYNPISEKENDLVLKLGECWNDFLQLETYNQDDLNDFRKAIHDAQRIVMAFNTIRNNPNTFRQNG